MRRLLGYACALSMFCAVAAAADADLYDQVEHHYADNDGVKIHYVSVGEGPVLVFLHGFPDYWYTWRHQMEGLSDSFKCVALDLRAYNKSDKPKGIENYKIELLLADIDAVVDQLGVDKVTIVGHDWGGALAWQYVAAHQDKVERLVICNLTHPKGYAAVIANPTEAQKKNTAYARSFATSEPDDSLSAEPFAGMVGGADPVVRERYREAFKNSYRAGMVNYYRANYGAVAEGEGPEMPDITCPVLQFHGLLDSAVDKDGLMRTWEWIANDYTLVTLPKVGHWVQRDGADMVTTTMKWWLLSRQ